ncbi:hypothetical protein KP509_35G032900 [Ceratopteris richardii]|uniref:K+ potassium transporter integral membrane domain-containing protein n=1 Tax=Ceratopteris richardii TaxID=49495 RepID=A0A8T2QFS2_CERRI|nr:hypothetical protein KP509_35G032900 [Ceratopteris richardii]
MFSFTIFGLAFQNLGIVYVDLGTSPLYVFRSTFAQGIPGERSLMGVLSCIIYSLTLIPLIKYTFFCHGSERKGRSRHFCFVFTNLSQCKG